jgi:hypothetical protein
LILKGDHQLKPIILERILCSEEPHMADEDELALPLDIPWQLLSRRGPDSPEDPTSLSTFVYVPRLPELDTTYPDDRLVYFKFTASVFPFHLDVPKVPPLNVLDEAFAPVWRMILDVEITAKRTPTTPGFKPYFLSAAPTRRAMIETGVVGDYFTEGESDEVAIGRSASHLIEGFHSTTKTRKFGIGGALGGLAFGVLPIGGGLSYSRGSTSISGGREVTEQLDTTNRQSSEERKELLSHMTNVSNVMTLLNGSLVGTNSLHFSLWPQPLRPLSIDPNDENLWYTELLKRRSSGIEGMQDFYAVAVVSRGEGFCVSENLRRVSVLEPPLPEPPVQPSVLFDTFDFNLNDFVRVFTYLSGKYPEGTPLEELDVSVEDRLLPDPAAVPPIPASHTRAALQSWYDIVGTVWIPNPLPPLPPPGPLESTRLNIWVNEVQGILANLSGVVKIDAMPRPVVSGWTFSNSVRASMFRLHPLTNPPSLPVPYKWVQDVWLEAVQYDYESQLAKSPLERGTVLIDDRQVDICADMDEDGAIGAVTTTIPAPPDVGVLPHFPGSAVSRPWDRTSSGDPRAKGRSMVSAWGMFEAQLGTLLAGKSKVAATPFSFQDSRAVEMYLRRAERIAAADRRNESLGEIGRRFRLTAADVQRLKTAGVTNLSSLASAILAAVEIQRLHAQPLVRDGPVLEAVGSRGIAPEFAHALIRAIGAALDALLLKHERTRPHPRHLRQQDNRRRKKR